MGVRFFNTYSRELEPFEPLKPGEVKMYTCGPTVYDLAHIGNFRAYIFEDLLQRHLEYRGFRVQRVMNFTDVDDKTIRGAREACVALRKFTTVFKEAFFEDMQALRVKQPDSFPAETDPENITRMIEMIALLVQRRFAYEAEDGSVYFRINSYLQYGKLAHLDLNELRPTGRVRNDEYEKEQLGDFALWKARDERDGEVWWESPWGRGRPGWHIECSAMATRLLGAELDIHCGGVDNIFPHHEAEIAQSECFTGKKFVRYWLHCAHLMVEGQKMAKSLGNFYTVRDLIAKGYSGREIRYALISVHYRAPLNFTFEGLNGARSALARLDEWVRRLEESAGDVAPLSNFQLPGQLEFGTALDDDLNIAGALGQLFETVRQSNAMMDGNLLQPAQAAALLKWWRSIDTILQLSAEEAGIPDAVRHLVAEREQARAERDWQRSDQLREKIQELGWNIKDTKQGPKLTRA